MRRPAFPFLAFLALAATTAGWSQVLNIGTLAGCAGQGSADGPGATAQLYHPSGVAWDGASTLYVADTANSTLRKLTLTGTNWTAVTIAGTAGSTGSADGPALSALFNQPQGIALDSAGNLYAADTGNFTIRKLARSGADWTVTTLAGQAGISGSTDGTGTNALFYEPEGLAVDGGGTVYVADTWNHTIRKISPSGMVSTLAGSAGTFGSANGTGSSALFYQPQAVALDSATNVYVADTANHTIRCITPGGSVTTLAGSTGNFGNADGTGTGALFYAPQGVAVDAATNVFVADYFNHTMRKVTPAGLVTTLAGAASVYGNADGTNSAARFWGPMGLASSPSITNVVYVADSGNSLVRQVAGAGTKWTTTTIAGVKANANTDASGAVARFYWPVGAAADASGNVYVADTENCTIRKVAPGGAVSTIAGQSGQCGSADGIGTNAQFYAPQGIALDGSGSLYVADTGNHTIRKLVPSGTNFTVRTLAGTAGTSGSVDGTGSMAQFYSPQGVVVDTNANVFVADCWNHTIRRVTAAGVVTTLAGSAGKAGCADGPNSAARFYRPAGLAIDKAGNLYVTDSLNHTLRLVTPAGVVTTLAGMPGVWGTADGTSSAARFFEPQGVAMDSVGNVYVADSGSYSVRKVSLVGTNWLVSTLAGWPGSGGSADGSGIAARFCYPAGLAMNTSGQLFVADSGNSTLRSGSTITNAPPLLLSQPQGQTVNQGGNVTFTVSATGGSTLYYQWQFNGVNLVGATGTAYTVANAQPSDAGSYLVVVTGATGSASSGDAVLVVNALPMIISQPTGLACVQGATARFSVLAMSDPLVYRWQKDGVLLTNGVNVDGADTPMLTLANLVTNDAAGYRVIVSNTVGAVTSAVATLAVDLPPPLDAVPCYAWWRLNEGLGVQALDWSGNVHNGAFTGAGVTWTNGHEGFGVNFDGSGATISIGNSFKLTNDWTAAMWVYRRHSGPASGLISGSTSELKLEQWNNTGQVGYTVPGIADYTFNYSAPLSTWTHLVFVKTSAALALYANGAPVGSNSVTIPLDVSALGRASTDYLDAVLDDVRVYNQALSAAQVIHLYAYSVISPLTNPAPVVTNPPASLICVPDGNATFAVVAGPQPFGYPLSYQWQKNGSGMSDGGNVAGASTSALTLSNVSANDAASYAVRISNNSGVVTSSVATLTLYQAPPAGEVPAYAWWRFNEGAGTQALDYSGNGHTCTLGSGTSWTNGHAGIGLDFNGTAAGIATIADPFVLSGDWSATFWVYRRHSGASSVLIGGSSTALKLEQWNNTGLVGFTAYGVADYTFSYSAPLSAWTHLGFVTTSAGTSLYANGALVSSSADTIALNASALSRAASDYLDAILNDVRVYNQALTTQQMTNLFAYGKTCNPPSQVRTNIVFIVAGATLTLSWPADHVGWRLQCQTNALGIGLAADWADVPGAVATNRVVLPIAATNGGTFFRLTYP